MPHTSQAYRFPSWLATDYGSLGLELGWLVAAHEGSVAALGHKELGAAFGAYVTLSSLVRHYGFR